jgi:hypothetical protein
MLTIENQSENLILDYNKNYTLDKSEKLSSSGKLEKSVTCQYWNKSPYPIKSSSPAIPNYKPLNKNKLRYINACENKDWTLVLLNKKSSELSLVCFKCKSWRHAGECSRARGALDFVRIKNAIKKLGDSWMYMVLTFDRSKSLFDSYRAILDCWDKFRKRLTREFGVFKYIVLIEQHGDGFPHCNVLIQNDRLYEACKEDGWKKLRLSWFDRHIQESGFGWKYWLEPMRSKEAISGYFVKLVGQMVGEFTKPSQNPVSAPKGFRRLRASKGLLEKISKNPYITGLLIQAPIDRVAKNLGLDSVEESIMMKSDDKTVETIRGTNGKKKNTRV